MTIIEQLVFQRLKEYREQANRERFILPEGKTIDLLSKKRLDNKNLYYLYFDRKYKNQHPHSMSVLK